MAQIEISDKELLKRAEQEAARSRVEDLNTLIAASLRYFLGVTEGVQRLEKAAQIKKSDSEASMLAEALGALSVSSDRLTAVADVLLQAAGAAPTFEQPGTLYKYVNGFLDWVHSSPDHAVACVVVSAQAASGDAGTQLNGIIGFSSGWLQLRGVSLAGSLDQYFSDRTAPGPAPFNPSQKDRLGVNISTDGLSGIVTVELIAESWGGARQSLRNIRLQAGVMVGEGDAVAGVAPSALYTLSLGTIVVPG